ncbi:MAG: ATP-binding protein [Rhodoglobus sp.]
MRSLRTRVTIVTIVVAVIAVAVTGLISLQLVRSSTTDEARNQLAAQADILAKLPRLASAAELADKASLALGGTLVALVKPDGTVQGDASPYVDALLLNRLAKSDAVSTTRHGDLGLVMVEARVTKNGQAVVVALPLTAVDHALGQATLRILIALGVGLVVAIVGGALLARRLSKPLTDTAAAARRLARGERGVRMPVSPTTEVHDVTAALASLDTALAASEGRQREFLLSISHELRTPLTAVRGYAEAMADGLVPPEQLRAVGETLVAETERLDRFVGDLLELARLEADDFSVTMTPVDVGTVLREAAAAWAGRASTLDVSVTATGDGTATTDARRLRQVIDGLVENALRVSPAGSTLQLSVSGASVLPTAPADAQPGATQPSGTHSSTAQPADARPRATHSGAAQPADARPSAAQPGADHVNTVVRVHDGGPGLAEDDFAVAFERGLLRARYRDIRPVGTGLGLSIAARLVERLGGTITVENAPTGGAVFAVTLPA